MKVQTTEVKRQSVGGALAREARLGQQLVWSIFNDPVSALFFRRQTAGGSVTSPALPQYGKALLSTIKGNSMVWNQLVQIAGSDISKSESGITITDNRDGSYSVSGTASADVIMQLFAVTNSAHTFLFRGCPQGGSASTYYFGSSATYCDTGSGYMRTFGGSGSYGQSIVIKAGTALPNPITFYPQAIDLTLLFNNAIPAGYTVADFERDYPLKYYGYNPGQIIDLTGQGLETVGFNQWDEEREGGAFDADGNPTSGNADAFRSKNFTRVFPSTDYCLAAINATSGCYFYITEYDGNKTKIKTSSGMTPTEPRVFTTTATTAYIKFHFYKSGSGWQANPPTFSICINISNATKNGTYEPYWKSTKNLGLDDIRVQSPNVWDEEWESGDFDNTGEPSVNANRIRSKNFIPVTEGATYYAKTPTDCYMVLYYYDASKGFLSIKSSFTNSTFTTPSDCAFIKFFIWKSGGAVTTYNYDITINVSSAANNGKYFPRRVPGLAKAGSAYDEIDVARQKYVKRLGRVDLSQLTWTSPSANRWAGVPPSDLKAITDAQATPNWTCSTRIPLNSSYDLSTRQDGICYFLTYLYCYKGDNNSPTGILKYELASPEEYDLETPMDAEFKMDYLGTEALSPENSSTPSTAKFSAEIKYPK